ncbi:MAG TPA: TolC family protein [Bacteroidales bacterium]|nr:TolC family protein [Bacteroidales bacterium]NMD02423.1 TolC family protein [Bacteroidales bacterium]HOU02539.1 TolC family protein [Bacteroidales bacterium]HQG64110.1 TolC family protein [Bacteroidales bacterium]HQK67821.1 TolC family protein [Bacteroidales bacterium]
MKKQVKTGKRINLAILLLIIHGLTAFAQRGLTLEQSLKVAEDNSPAMKRTRLNLIRSQENLNAQNAALKSNFSLSVNPLSYRQDRSFNDLISAWNTTKTTESYGVFTVSQPILLTDARVSLLNKFGYVDSYSEYSNNTNKGFSNSLSLNLSQPIFTYNRTRLQLKELQLAHENAQLNYAIQLLSLERQVTISFYNVYQKQQSLEIDRQAYENMQKSYEIIKNKVDAGLSAREEIFQAELNLASSKSSFENSQVSFENAKDEFKILIGISLYDDLLVLPNIEVDTVGIDVAFAIDQGLANRMEIRQSQINLETSQFDLITTKALNEFKGQLDLSVGLFGDNENLGNLYENPTDNESVSLSLTIPLWDWGERKSRIKASEASIESSKISLEEEQNDIILNIRQVCRNLINLKNQIEIARQNVNNAQLTYDLNLEKYRNGDLTGMDLNIYQNQLSQQQISYTNSLISYKLELLNLKIQTLYDFEKNVPVTPVKTL